MRRAERDAILRQGVVLPETPRQRRERAGLEEDLRSIALTGKPLPVRLRNFAPSADTYLAATRGPRPHMLRLREIETRTAHHEEEIGRAWHQLAVECGGDDIGFARLWRSEARRFTFDEVNDLIERHNRWYPVEAQLAMDPRTGDYVLVAGRDYRLALLDTAWVLERFPPALELVHRSAA
jgi:hypothetical protein